MPGLLVVNRNDSRCGECGKSCSPHHKRHDVLAGYRFNTGPGCGAEWDLVSSDYVGDAMERVVRGMRPDLAWVPVGIRA